MKYFFISTQNLFQFSGLCKLAYTHFSTFPSPISSTDHCVMFLNVLYAHFLKGFDRENSSSPSEIRVLVLHKIWPVPYKIVSKENIHIVTFYPTFWTIIVEGKGGVISEFWVFRANYGIFKSIWNEYYDTMISLE